MSIKKIFSFCIAVLLLFNLSSCGAQPTEEKFGKVGILYYDLSDGYTFDLSAAIEAVLSDAAVEFEQYDAQNDSSKQLSQAAEAISSGITALAVNIVDTVSDSSAQKIVELASSSGVPLIFFDRYVDTSVIDSYEKCIYIGTALEEACNAQGQQIKSYLFDNFDAIDVDDNGIIRYVSYLSNSRSDGIALNEINSSLVSAGLPNMEPYSGDSSNLNLKTQKDGWSTQDAEKVLSEILDELGEEAPQMVELVYTDNTYAALGSQKALQEHNLAVPVFAQGCTDELMELIDSSDICGTVSSDASLIAMSVTAVVTNIIAGSSFFTDVTTGTITGNYLYLSSVLSPAN